VGAALVVAAVIGIFFAVGLIVGGIGVIALPKLRDRRPGRREPAVDTIEPEYDHVAPDAAGPAEAGPDDRPGWPGEAGRNLPRPAGLHGSRAGRPTWALRR
jgi:hypothetical protein